MLLNSLRCALDTAYEITKLIKFSPKRNAAFDRIKNELSTEDSTSDFCRSIKKFFVPPGGLFVESRYAVSLTIIAF